MALPNLWGLYNLRSSPFFQATLRQDTEVTPLSLFVGRERERQLLLTTIGGSRSSRQAVAGRPGIGKTSLVQAVKADALAAGYWTSAEIIPVTAEGSSEDLLGRLLSGAYDAVLASYPEAGGPAVEAASRKESPRHRAPWCWMGRGCCATCWPTPSGRVRRGFCCTSTTSRTSAKPM